MHLDFEQPIIELEEKLQEMKQLAESSKVDVSEDVKSLENKIQKLKGRHLQEKSNSLAACYSYRHPERPYTYDYIYNITDDFVEIHGDRSVSDDKAMVGGFVSMARPLCWLVNKRVEILSSVK